MKVIRRLLVVAIGFLVLSPTLSASWFGELLGSGNHGEGQGHRMAVGEPALFPEIDAADELGTLRSWNLEMGNPTDITQRGFKRNTFKPGDEVTVTLQPVKSGAPVGRIRFVILPNGQKL